MLACLDYIVAQNKADGEYKDKVDLDHVVASGYSQGGGGTLMAGKDDRFIATATVSPFIVLPLGGFDVASVKQQKHPHFMISGSLDIVAEPSSNQGPIFSDAPVPIVWGTFDGNDHLAVLGNGGAYRGPLTAWFRARMMNDAKAAAMFKKDECGLCKVSGWSVKFNEMWKD
jgi:hypothetical protein